MKPIDVDKFFNRRFIISELEYSLNDYDVIDASVVLEGETKASSVVESVQEYDRTMDEVCEEVEATVVPEKIRYES